jgi:HD-like signal output (HDOD) protein
MPHEATCIPPEQAEAAVLGLLTDAEVQRPWAVAELEREIGHPVRTADAVARLYAAGLVHRFGEFVFATRAAIRGVELR